MPKFEHGDFAVSLCGRDKGKILAVIEENKCCVLVADGKERPLERPKRKNPSHLGKLTGKAPEEAFRGNRALRKVIKIKADDEESKKSERKAVPQ